MVWCRGWGGSLKSKMCKMELNTVPATYTTPAFMSSNQIISIPSSQQPAASLELQVSAHWQSDTGLPLRYLSMGISWGLGGSDSSLNTSTVRDLWASGSTCYLCSPRSSKDMRELWSRATAPRPVRNYNQSRIEQM